MNKKLRVLFKQRGNVIHSVSGGTQIKDAVDLMNKHHIGALMVISIDGGIEGIITERDVMKKLASTDELVGHLEVREIMTPYEKLIYTTGDESLGDIMKLLTEKKVRHLPIVSQDGVLEGMLSMRDVIRMLLQESKQMEKTLTDYISGTYPA
ncbi:MAG: CBS domain-containing protein [Candidatus Cloacimonetes bacterium]|nr:CBS domain-containing protein [Candidatus Cloacimonadota bacterium]